MLIFLRLFAFLRAIYVHIQVTGLSIEISHMSAYLPQVICIIWELCKLITGLRIEISHMSAYLPQVTCIICELFKLITGLRIEIYLI